MSRSIWPSLQSWGWLGRVRPSSHSTPKETMGGTVLLPNLQAGRLEWLMYLPPVRHKRQEVPISLLLFLELKVHP